MSGSTTNLDLIATSQAQKEVTANALFDAGSPATLYGRRASTCAALTWGYYGGAIVSSGSDGLSIVPNGTVALDASATNYVEADSEGVVTVNQTAFTSGQTPLHEIVTDSDSVTSYTDWRITVRGVSGTVDSVNGQTGVVVLDANDIEANDPGGYFTTDALTVEQQLQEIGAVLGSVGGTVTSVAASVPSFLSISGSPVTTAGTLAISYSGTALPVANGGTGITAFGTGIATALGVNVGSAGAPVINGGALGTPSSGTLTNATGLPVAGGGTGVATLTAYAPVFGGTTGTGAVQSGTVGTAGQVLTSNGAGALPTMQSPPFVAGFLHTGEQTTASQFLGMFAAPAGITTLTAAAAIAGSSGKGLVAATAQTDIDVRKNAATAAGGSSVGTIRWAAAGTVPSFIAASGFTLTGGTDYLTFWGPATPDATLADFGATLYFTR